MSITEKLVKIAENEPKVYEAGKVSQIQGIAPAKVDASLFNGKLKTVAENTIRVFEKGRADANQQKATASGKVIRVDDVSPIEHNLKVDLTSDTLTDFSGVSVTRYGKNLLKTDERKVTYTTVNVTVSSGVFSVVGTSAQSGGRNNRLTPIITLAAGTYTVSSEDKKLSKYVQNAVNNAVITAFSSVSVTFTLETETDIYIGSNFISGTVYDEHFHVWIEAGSTSTDYEPYKEPQTAIASADGTVNGLTSLSPTMTLIPDTSSVNINLEYYRG